MPDNTATAPEEKRPIDHVRSIIKSFPPKYYFYFDTLTNKLDAMDIKYNRGGLKGGILATLLRLGEIEKDLDAEGLVRYRRRNNTAKKKPANRQQLKPNTTLIALLLSKQFLTANQIAKDIKEKIGIKTNLPAIQFNLKTYSKKGYLTLRVDNDIPRSPTSYKANQNLFQAANHIREQLISYAPTVAMDIFAILYSFEQGEPIIENNDIQEVEKIKSPPKKPSETKLSRKSYIRVSPTLAILVLSKNFLTAEEIQIRIEKQLNISINSATIYQTLQRFKQKNLIEERINTLVKGHLKEYKATSDLYKAALKIREFIAQRYPDLKEQLNIAFEEFEKRNSQIDNLAQQQNIEKVQEAEKPVDWELPENYFAAADLGAAMFEYMRRLNRQLNQAPKGQEAEKLIAKLKYDNDELKAQIFSRNNKLHDLEREKKRLTNRVDSLTEENQELKDETHNLRIKLDQIQGRIPKSSFKLSEVANIKRFAEGETIDGSKQIELVK
jgi:DNA-binding PadR family transcriptional regulator